MLADEHTATIPIPVKEVPHWRVIIRPETFEAERIKSLKECWSLMETCRVSLRGWDYPHVDRENRANGEDYIASWCDVIGHQEYWKLFQSGQFVHLFSFREDAYHEEVRERAKSIHFPKGFIPSGFLDFISTLYTITEVFEFTARLAQKGVLGTSVYVMIQMTKIKNRVIFAWDPMRIFYGFCPATEENLAKEQSIEPDLLISESAKLAREVVVWFFERFQWMDPSLELLANEQLKFLERRM